MYIPTPALPQSIPFVATCSFLTFGQVQRAFQVLLSFDLQFNSLVSLFILSFHLGFFPPLFASLFVYVFVKVVFV
jgi:hypothetical protein